MDKKYDLVIIDEIQMIEDIQRGAAWSRAVMGVNAKKVIIIGSPNTKPFIEKILEKTKDAYKVKNFERKTYLKLYQNENGEHYTDYSNLERGDAIICFSRKDIYRLKNIIEQFELSFSIVYGALPPKTRIIEA